MKKYIEINDNEIIVCKIDYHISPAIKIKPQKIKIKDIKIIGWALRLLIDDESPFLVIVKKNGEIIPINTDYFYRDKQFEIQFNRIFNTNLYSEELSKFDPYDGKGKSFVIFPQQIKGTPLYKENYSGFIPFAHSILRFFFIFNLGKGVLTDDCKKYLKNKS